MAGRPRTSPDPHAHRNRILGNVELAGSAPGFREPSSEWLPETLEAYDAYRRSDTARALREEDLGTVFRLFGYLDRITRWGREIPDDPKEARERLTAIRTLEEIVSRLSASLGLGPRGRQTLGIQSEAKPGAELDAWLRG